MATVLFFNTHADNAVRAYVERKTLSSMEPEPGPQQN